MILHRSFSIGARRSEGHREATGEGVGEVRMVDGGAGSVERGVS